MARSVRQPFPVMSDDKLREAKWNAIQEEQRPSVMFRPKLAYRGDGSWQAIYGDLRVSGATPSEAMYNFDDAWVDGPVNPPR